MEESLESLWFYNNVLSSKASLVSDTCNSLTLTKHVEDEEEEEEHEAHEEVLHIVEDETKKTEQEFKNEAFDVADVAVEFCYFTSLSKKEEERRRRRVMRARSKKGMHGNMRRKILGELDLKEEEFHVVKDDWYFLEEGFGYKNYCQRLNLDDNMAMKEHLKTWAHAVACTVR